MKFYLAIRTNASWWLPAMLLLLARAAAAEYTLTMTPRFAPAEMLERLAPMAKMLGEVLHSKVDIVLATDFQDYERKLTDGVFDIAFSNPNHYSRSGHFFHEVMAMDSRKAGPYVRGIIIVRTDSEIINVRDLLGHEVAIVSWQSTAGYLSQKVFLESQGIKTNTQLKLTEAYGNKQENVILSVYHQDVQAGFINEDALHMVDNYINPEEIRILAYTTQMPGWALSVKQALPVMVKDKIRQAILDLQPDDAVLKAIKVHKFVSAVDGDYNLVRRALDLPISQPAK